MRTHSMTNCFRFQVLLTAACMATGLLLPLQADDTPVRPIPDSPIAAEATLDLFELHPDCRIELVAAEPDVIDPVHIAFDPAGRLWVVEYSDYPNGPGESEPGTSRIRVLTDEDGDGRYENPRVFADKLLFANGLMHWRDGVLVTMNGQLVFMRDTDGDGRADEQQPWFSGFKIDNPQLRANHPTLGLDNQIYVASGIRGGDVVAVREDWSEGAEPVSLSGRDFRFDPLTGEYESISGPAQFGLTFDDWGNRFIVSNRNPCDHIVLEGRHLQRNPLVAISSVVEHVSPIAGDSRVYPISRTWTTSNLHQNTFTAACGVCIYRGDALPAAFYGNSFTCEPTGNLVHRDVLEPNGATFTSHYGREGVEFLASTDEWFRPVNQTIGPDGALYVVDMYRAVIEHPQFMPEELQNRPDLFQGTDRGRIYRIVAADAPPAAERNPVLLAEASAEELLSQLSHPNSWQRETAHRLLLEGEGQTETTIERLRELAENGDTKPAAHALWILDGLGQLDRGTLSAVLDAADAHAVAAAVKLAELRYPDDGELRRRISEIAVHTEDARLAFQCILSLAEGGAVSDEINPTATEWLLRDADNDWFRSIVALTINPEGLAEIVSGLIERGYGRGDPTLHVETARNFGEIVGRSGSQVAINALLQALHDDPRRHIDGPIPEPAMRRQMAALLGLSQGLSRNRKEILQVVADEFPDHRTAVEYLFNGALARVEFEFPDNVDPEDLDFDIESWKTPGILLLRYSDSDRTVPALASLIESGNQDLAILAIRSLSAHSSEDATTLLLDGVSRRSPALRSATISALLSTIPRTRLLLAAVEAGDIAPLEIDPARARQLMNHGDPEIKAKARELLALPTPADRQEVLANYQESLTMESDPLRGQEVFKLSCIQCHRIGTLGVNVAPDISDSRTKTREQLLVSVLDPNRAIDNNYFSYSILDTDGIVHTGVISSETATAVTLKQPEGKEVTILRTNIDEMRSTGLSLMPVGLEEKVSTQQMADLISFIKNWRYLDGLVPEEVIR